VIYIGLYFSKGLYLIVALNVFLLAMCFAGYARWRIAASMARLNAAA
jgi:hypothetical protein